MKKAYLAFKLPEQRLDLEYALNGKKYAGIIWELDKWLKTTSSFNLTSFEVREKLKALLKSKYEIIESGK